MNLKKIISSPVKVRAQTEPSKGKGTKLTTEKKQRLEKGEEEGCEKSAYHPPERARMNSGLVAGHVLTTTIQGGTEYIEIPLPFIQACRVHKLLRNNHCCIIAFYS